MVHPTERLLRMRELVGEERDFDVLIRSLARKILNEQNINLPSSVLAGISGVGEKEWDRLFSKRRNYLNDILSFPVREAGLELEALDGDERNFIDKMEQVIRIIYWGYSSYPEVVVLFHELHISPETDEQFQVSGTIDSLMDLIFDLLKRQAYEEGIVERGSQMEKLLFFLFQQMILAVRKELLQLCESYVECRNPSVFPEEDEFVDRFLDPVKEQLKGFTAV